MRGGGAVGGRRSAIGIRGSGPGNRLAPMPAAERRTPASGSCGSASKTAGRNWRSSSSRSNWSNCAQKSQATSGAGLAGVCNTWSTKPSSVPSKFRPRSRSSAASCDSSTVSSTPGLSSTPSMSLRDLQRIARVVQHASPIHRRGNGSSGVRHHRHALVERLDDRDAEPLVLARAEEQISDVVQRSQLFIRDVPEKVDVGCFETRDELVQHRQISFEPTVRTDEQQPRPRIVARTVGMEGADDRLELLVRNHASDKHHVRPTVVEVSRQHAVRLDVQVSEVGDDGENAGWSETERLELLTVVLRIAEREIGAADVRRQFPPAPEAELHEVFVHADEVLRRGDVVIDDGHASRQRVRDARRSRADREVMNQYVVRRDLPPPSRGSRWCWSSSRGSAVSTKISESYPALRRTRWIPRTSWPIASP